MPAVRAPEYRLKLTRTLPNDRIIQRQDRVVPECIVRIDHVAIECRTGNVVPDVVVTSAGFQLLIEIAVTHPCDRVKLRALRRSNLATLEIKLSEEDAWLSREQLQGKLADGLQGKHWLFHPRQRNVEREFFRELRTATRKLRQQRRDQQRYRQHTLARARAKQPTPFTQSGKTTDWREFDHFAHEFVRAHGRWPSLTDTQAFCAKRQGK
jgi:hypothetical protein